MDKQTPEIRPQSTRPIPPPRRGPLFTRQPMMVRMLVAIAPVAVVGVYFFGWRVLALLVMCTLAGVVTEGIMATRRRKPVSLACLVTCALYSLSLPPTMPFWMALVGIVVGILFGKEVFGGFGKNWANPAIVGRAFVYVAFPVEMTGSFVPAFRGVPGGFAHWSFATLREVPAWLSGAAAQVTDAVTMATPSVAMRDHAFRTDWTQLFFGNIGGTFEVGSTHQLLAAGSIGEVCAPLLIFAGVYLLWTRTADWRLMLTPVIGALAMNGILILAGAGRTLPMVQMLFGGSLLYGAVFMVTEPISGPRTKGAKWMYGLFIGIVLVLIRWKGSFAGSLSFSILLGNMVGPTMDMGVRAWRKRRKSRDAA